MLHPNTYFQDVVLVAITIVASIIFILMLVTAVALLRSEKKTGHIAGSRDEIEKGARHAFLAPFSFLIRSSDGVIFHNVEIKAEILYNEYGRPVQQNDCRYFSGGVIKNGR